MFIVNLFVQKEVKFYTSCLDSMQGKYSAYWNKESLWCL